MHSICSHVYGLGRVLQRERGVCGDIGARRDVKSQFDVRSEPGRGYGKGISSRRDGVKRIGPITIGWHRQHFAGSRGKCYCGTRNECVVGIDNRSMDRRT